MEALHIGKLTEEAKTTVTDDMHAHVISLARKANCTPSELYREAIYLYLTGETFSEHVANDRRSVMVQKGPSKGELRAAE
ncbi:MAG: hypothetical protein HHJ15_16660 [Rhodoferax sp.]|uniref:hypothetical protein n=1 Tax=Rhodoferax sp. TaxID=50421 RepID=UPI00179F7586|nr:hypothetical protein [Rhodoferax sp.]NMM21560.1 hypothetical protein [Rhodoferax sp.]